MKSFQEKCISVRVLEVLYAQKQVTLDTDAFYEQAACVFL